MVDSGVFLCQIKRKATAYRLLRARLHMTHIHRTHTYEKKVTGGGDVCAHVI